MSLNDRVLRVPQPMMAEQKEERKRTRNEYEKYFSTAEGQAQLKAHLDDAARKFSADLGLTGNPQYDDFVKRAEYAKWWQRVKDIPFTGHSYP